MAEPDILAQAKTAFEAGDYRTARRLAREVTGGDERTQAQARRIVTATGVDRVQLLVLLACLLFLGAVCYHYLLR